MGFGEAELDALKHPALISVLANASVSWCSVTVNREVLQRLLNQAQDVEKEIATVDRMLRLGASTEMVSRFYGLTHQEVALRREILGLPKRRGATRPGRDPGHRTVAAMEGGDQQQERRSGGRDLDSRCGHGLAEGMSLPLSVVWAAIRNWVDQGLGWPWPWTTLPRAQRPGPIALADLFDAALKASRPSPALALRVPACSNAQASHVRRRLPVQWQSARACRGGCSSTAA